MFDTIFQSTIFAFKLVWGSSKYIFIAAAVCVILLGILPAVNQISIKFIIDSIESKNLYTLRFSMFSLCLAVIVYAIVNRISEYLDNVLRVITQAKIRYELACKISSLDVYHFEDPEKLDAFERVKREASYRPAMMVTALLLSIQSFVLMAMYFFTLSSLSSIAAVLIAVFAISNVFAVKKSGDTIHMSYQSLSRVYRKIFYYEQMLTTKDYIKEMKIFSYRRAATETLRSYLKRSVHETKSAEYKRNRYIMLSEVIGAIIQISLLFGFLLQAFNGNISIGSLILAIASIAGLKQSVSSLAGQFEQIYESALFISDYRSVMNEESLLKSGDEDIGVQKNEDIIIKNLTFTYPGSSKAAIDNLSVDIKSGHITAVVGKNGSGKTTLVKLIARFYDPDAGEICLGQTNIRNFNIESYQSLFSVVMQDYMKYEDTLFNNIGLSFGKPYDLKKISESIARSDLDMTVAKLDKREMTQLGRMFNEDGVDLSGGQWQKVALARAIYKESSICILDEPSSSLDAESERKAVEIYAKEFDKKTTLIITHRLTTVKLADSIIFMENGKIIEKGTHAELMHLNGRYAKMYNDQAGLYEG